MKELSVEEKASMYDEAIERAKYYQKENGSAVIFAIFPELAESEDEMIRKELIDFLEYYRLNNVLDNNTILLLTDSVAWLEKQGNKDEEILVLKDQIESLEAAIKALKEAHKIELEKQGEQKSIDDLTPQEVMDIAVAKFFEQGEQKPTDKVEPKFKVGDIIKPKCYNETHSIKAIGERYYILDVDIKIPFRDEDNWKLVEQKPAWSEEDEDYYDAIIAKLEATQDDALEFLKFLKDRIQSQNTITDEELAQAKKDAYNDALNKIEYHSDEPTFDDGWSAAIWYLKKRNAQPQSTWKPSDEQMEGIECTIKTLRYQLNAGDNRLDSLYNDLKKLREK